MVACSAVPKKHEVAARGPGRHMLLGAIKDRVKSHQAWPSLGVLSPRHPVRSAITSYSRHRLRSLPFNKLTSPHYLEIASRTPAQVYCSAMAGTLIEQPCIGAPASLRVYTSDDHEDVVRLLTPVLRDLYPEGEVWLARRLDDIVAGKASCILAIFQGKMVGVAITTPKKPGRVKLSTLYVSPGARGRGIGKQILRATLARLRMDGVDDVYITAAHTVAEQIAPLLIAQGFIRLNRSPNRYGPGRHEDIYEAWLS